MALRALDHTVDGPGGSSGRLGRPNGVVGAVVGRSSTQAPSWCWVGLPEALAGSVREQAPMIPGGRCAVDGRIDQVAYPHLVPSIPACP